MIYCQIPSIIYEAFLIWSSQSLAIGMCGFNTAPKNQLYMLG